MMKVLEGLPRTLDTMPSCTTSAMSPVERFVFLEELSGHRACQFLVTRFNTQRLVRIELDRDSGEVRSSATGPVRMSFSSSTILTSTSPT